MSEQYINKGDLIRWLDGEIKQATKENKKALTALAQKVITMQEADVRKNEHGFWQRSECRSMFDGKGIVVWHCSCCRTVGQPHKRFCSECGALMDWRSYE